MTFFQKVGRLKVYFSSASFYLGVFNFLLLLATFKKVYGVQLSVWLIMPLGLLGVLLLGWLDYSFVLRHQLEHSNRMNDLKVQLDRIEKKVFEK